MTDILYPSKSRRFMSEVAGVRRYHRNSGRTAAAVAVACCGSPCAKAGAATPTAWPPSSPSSKDRSASHEGRFEPSRNNRLPPDLRVTARLPRGRGPIPRSLRRWALGAAHEKHTQPARAEPEAWLCLGSHQHLQGRLFGKRSASGRRR